MYIYNPPRFLSSLPSMATQLRYITNCERERNQGRENAGENAGENAEGFQLYWNVAYDRDVEQRMNVVRTDHSRLLEHTTLNSERALAFATNANNRQAIRRSGARGRGHLGSGINRHARFDDISNWKDKPSFPLEKRARSCPNNLRTIQLASRYSRSTVEDHKWMQTQGWTACKKTPNTW